MNKKSIAKTSYFTLIFFLAAAGFSNSPAQGISNEITAGDLRESVYFLAADSLKGRMTGTLEATIAAEYIKSGFAKSGVKPAFTKSYFQEYSFIAGVELTKNNKAALFIGKEKKSLILESDYRPLAFSGNATVSAPLAFAGYGISAPKLKYDDYENLDVKGKIVLVFRSNPEYNDPHTSFEEYSSMRSKSANAKEKGALGIIFINPPLPKTEEDKFAEFKYDRAPGMKDFPVLQIKRALAEKIFLGKGQTLSELQAKISETKKPGSFVLAGFRFTCTVGIKEVERKGINVAGIIDGSDPVYKNEYILLGAHYDHLGMGGDGSLYRGKDPQVHNGADDNASGVAALLELAQSLAAQPDFKRSILLAAFSGEELGLLGSNYFSNNTPVSVESICAMFNFDMVGRINKEKNLIIYGTGTSPVWKPLLDSLNTAYGFKLTKNDEGYGPSDHSSFYAKNIPVLFFFTGTHADYHRPSDDADKLDYSGTEQVIRYAFDNIIAVANVPVRPRYVNVPRKQGERTGGWSVYVGTIPDYAFQGEGLKITGVSEGSPAQKAGLQGGDIITDFGDAKITNIYDYVYALKNHVPGDVVEVQLTRENKSMKVTVELAAK